MWKYKINEIVLKSLLSISIEFTLIKDSANYVVDFITFQPSQFDGLTGAQKLQTLKLAIEEKCSKYINAYNASSGLQSYIGSEVEIT